jgi:hypothetical protein
VTEVDALATFDFAAFFAAVADMALTMRLTQWLARPAAEFIHPANSHHRPELL